MTLFTVHLRLGTEHTHIDYSSIDACLHDEPLMDLLDRGAAEVLLWVGPLRLTGTPITTARELREALVENSKTILRRVLCAKKPSW